MLRQEYECNNVCSWNTQNCLDSTCPRLVVVKRKMIILQLHYRDFWNKRFVLNKLLDNMKFEQRWGKVWMFHLLLETEIEKQSKPGLLLPEVFPWHLQPHMPRLSILPSMLWGISIWQQGAAKVSTSPKICMSDLLEFLPYVYGGVSGSSISIPGKDIQVGTANTEYSMYD